MCFEVYCRERSQAPEQLLRLVESWIDLGLSLLWIYLSRFQQEHNKDVLEYKRKNGLE